MGEYHDNYRKTNRAKLREQAKEYYRTNKEACRERMRVQNLKKFGMTAEDYARMEMEQGGMCAICLQPETAIDPRSKEVRSLSVDHDHVTGKVRGLLCGACNVGLGKFADSPERLTAALKYLS
jgi:Recombination endonuclease VII